MNAPIELFRFCPRCGKALPGGKRANFIECGACGLLYFLNAVVAAGAIIVDDRGRALFLRRAKDPGKGKLGLPGGFADIGETAEENLRREVREEINIELASLEFLCSSPNPYEYRGVTYPVLDLFFTARAKSLDAFKVLEEAEGYCWLAPDEVCLDDIAFPSVRAAVSRWLEKQRVRAG
ncbi:MAG: NUDIX domain-containing protein [Verrucomicrobia bacterium]|nr:NUDIX domain-containing protein [Verrucomicrobiota bacterium]